MAAALGVAGRAQRGRDDGRSARRSATSHVVIVVDNCEHLLPGIAELVAALLASSAGVRVLATSREPLGVAGERVCPIDPLPVPPADASVERDRGLRRRRPVPRPAADEPGDRAVEPRRARRRRLRSAAPSTGSRWVSSWPRRGVGRCRCRSWPNASHARSASWPRPSRRASPVTARCAPPSTGGSPALAAGTGSAAGDERVRRRMRPRRVRRGLCRRRRTAGRRGARRARPHVVRHRRPPTSERATACSNRSASTPANSSTPAAAPPTGAAATSTHYLDLARTLTNDIDQIGFDTQWDELRPELGNFRAALDWASSDRDSIDTGLRLASRLWDLWSTDGHHEEALTRIDGLLDGGADRRKPDPRPPTRPRSSPRRARRRSEASSCSSRRWTRHEPAATCSARREAAGACGAFTENGDVSAPPAPGNRHPDGDRRRATTLLHAYCEIALAELLSVAGELDEAVERLVALLTSLVDTGGHARNRRPQRP